MRLVDGGFCGRRFPPRDFISRVQVCKSSATSSGSTLVRSQASDHCFLVAVVPLATGADFLRPSSLLLKTFEKKLIMYGDQRRKVIESQYN